MKVQMMPLDAIKPYPGNPRKIPKRAVEIVARSIREFGFRQPIVVDTEGIIIAGHVRWKAAKKLGLAKVPVHVAADLTPEQAKAYRLADNRSAEESMWDYDGYLREVASLQLTSEDLEALGLSEMPFIASEEPQDKHYRFWDIVRGWKPKHAQFRFGAVEARLPIDLYERFRAALPAEGVKEWLEEVLDEILRTRCAMVAKDKTTRSRRRMGAASRQKE